MQYNTYAQCGLKIESFLPKDTISKYCSHIFNLNNKNILFKIAKKTPKKTGWFVTLWKRNSDNIGQFIFPKTVLLEKKILSQNNKGGKRAIRVYTPWDKVTSTQASQTQSWHSPFFVDLKLVNSDSFLKIKTLYFM